jgi:hypothetical protein
VKAGLPTGPRRASARARRRAGRHTEEAARAGRAAPVEAGAHEDTGDVSGRPSRMVRRSRSSRSLAAWEMVTYVPPTSSPSSPGGCAGRVPSSSSMRSNSPAWSRRTAWNVGVLMNCARVSGVRACAGRAAARAPWAPSPWP